MATRRRHLFTGAGSVAIHVLMLAAFMFAQPKPAPVIEPAPILIQLVKPIPPTPPADSPKPPAPKPDSAPKAPAKTPAKAAPAKPAAPVKAPDPKPPTPTPRTVVKPTPTPKPTQVLPIPAAVEAPAVDPADNLSDAEIAAAATAGSGGSGAGAGGGSGGSGTGTGTGGGTCNMPEWLQAQLRKDPQVQAVAARAHRGRPMMVWNGDWIRREGEEGNGLAHVREAIMWEVAFAPAACRAKPVRGLVLISMSDAPGSPRIVLGQAAWRWSDLLFAKQNPLADPVKRGRLAP